MATRREKATRQAMAWFLPDFRAARTAGGQLSLLIQYHDRIGTGGDMHVYALLHAWISG